MKKLFIFIFCATSVLQPTYGDTDSARQQLSDLKSQGIENSANQELRELYEKLESQISQLDNIETQYLSDLQENADQMREKEQSTENKILGAAGIGATGIGGMQAASAMAEQNADQDAEEAMTAYLATFTCDYGSGQKFSGGSKTIELPAINLIDLKSEYLTLATDLKQRKASLELPFGIESEPILDAATSGLYDDISVGKTDGVFTSISDAILNATGEDATEWDAQKSDTVKKLKTGVIVAGVGAIGSAVANLVINKDAPKESSKKIKSEYESKKQTIETEITQTESQLNTAITDNKNKIAEYNRQLAQHQDFIPEITHEHCIEKMQEYIQYINSKKPITDDFADTENLTITYDLQTQKSQHEECTTEISNCTNQPHHEWKNGECVDNTPPPPESETPVSETPDNDSESSESGTNNEDTPGDENSPEGEAPAAAASNDPDQCPAVNERLRSLNEHNRVGDFCSYGNVSAGRVFKYTSGKYQGQCSCSATACKTGYKLEKGRCIQDENAGITPAPVQVSVKYHDVCKSDEKDKSGGTEYCIDKPFNWTNVQMLQATALAAEYALVKNGHNVVCENEWRKSGNDDWFSCTSIDNQYFYEFKFDDVAESVDSVIQHNLRLALCEALYDGELNEDPEDISAPDCALPDPAKRDALISTAEKFGIKADADEDNEHGVNFSHSQKMLLYETKKIDGIDPFAFYSGDIQIRANGQMIDGLYSYVAMQLAPTNITAFTCNRNPFQVIRKIDDRKTKGSSDDVLPCHVNGTPVDFVFDDMSELSKTLSRGGYSNMNCTVVGGTYNGRECMYVGEHECMRIQKLSAATMPSNKLPFWNSNTKQCELPAAADATEYQRNINIGIMAGGILVGAIVTVVTAGTGASALALLAAETAGGIIEFTATLEIYNSIDEFLEESQKCKNAKCAEQMLRDNLQRMSNMTFDMTDAQINGIDAELARLADLIPTDSTFYQKIAKNGTSTADNSLGFFDADSWEPEQVWRAVGVTLQLTSLITGIGKWISGKVNKLPRATRAIAKKANNVQRALPTPRDPNIGGGGTGRRATGAADNATRGTGARNATGAADTADDASDAARGASATDNAARGAGDEILHDDLIKYQNADATQKNRIRRQLFAKYHPDTVSKFKNQQLTDQANELTRYLIRLNSTDTKTLLSDDELKTLSRLMKQFDTDLAAAEDAARAAAQAAEDAAQTARGAGATDNADNATRGTGARNTSGAADTADNATRSASNISEIARKPATEIMQHLENMTYAERQTLLPMLSREKKLEIARLKVASGKVNLPYGLTVDDLAQDDDLLNIVGAYDKLDSEMLSLQRQARLDPKNEDIDNKLFEAAKQKYVKNPEALPAVRQYGQNLRTKYLEIFKSDETLREYALRYNTLTKTDKANLGELILHDLKAKLGITPDKEILVMVADSTDDIRRLAREYLEKLNIATSNTIADLTREIRNVIDSGIAGSWSITKEKNIIFLNSGRSHFNNFDGYMTYLSHEMGHITQSIAPEVTSAPQIMSKTAEYRGLATGDYMNNAVEFESWIIQEIVGNGFTDAIRAL